ncbi:MAG: rhomboid family intramembrane serine protease [Pseudomonadota bacterium]
MTIRTNRIAPGIAPLNARVHPALWAMVGLWALVQAAGDLADMGLLPWALNTYTLRQLFAFHGEDFGFAMQTLEAHPQLLWSTVTYALLHGGWLHLGLNAAVFLALAHGISRDAGIWPTMAMFAATAVAGALAYGLIAGDRVALVGASGGVFGLLGVMTRWQTDWLKARGGSLEPIIARVLGLALINLLMLFALPSVAWEGHLGGFLMGWVMGWVFPPRVRQSRDRDRFA